MQCDDFLRPIYFLVYYRELRSALIIFKTIIIRCFPIFACWAFNIVLAGCIARVLFFDTDEGYYMLDNFPDALFYIFVC